MTTTIGLLILSVIGLSVIGPLTWESNRSIDYRTEEFNYRTILIIRNQEKIIDDQLWVFDAGCQVSVVGEDLLKNV
jgi:hypothetical protein